MVSQTGATDAPHGVDTMNKRTRDDINAAALQGFKFCDSRDGEGTVRWYASKAPSFGGCRVLRAAWMQGVEFWCVSHLPSEYARLEARLNWLAR